SLVHPLLLFLDSFLLFFFFLILIFFFFTAPAPSFIYTLSLHDALPILSFIGLIYPVIPSSLFIWIGFLMYHFLIDNATLHWLFWSVMAGFTILLLLADVIANSYFVKRRSEERRVGKECRER